MLSVPNRLCVLLFLFLVLMSVLVSLRVVSVCIAAALRVTRSWLLLSLLNITVRWAVRVSYVNQALAQLHALDAAHAPNAQASRAARKRMQSELRKAGQGRGRKSPVYAKAGGYTPPASAVLREHMAQTLDQRRTEYFDSVELIKQRRSEGATAQASVASGAGAPSGLVYCSTSDTENKSPHVEVFGVPAYGVEKIELDTANVRIRKMSRSVMKGTELHSIHQSGLYERSATIMATMTYRKDQQPDAKDVSACLKAARTWFDRKYIKLPKEQRPKLRYVWVAELTKKGRLHYHVLFFLPPMVKLPMFDVRKWWTKGSTRLEWARCARSYMAKYASKGSTGRGAMPKGFRMHGTGGLTLPERQERRYHMAPSWVRELFTLEDRPRTCPGGGWISQVTGEAWPSPYEVLSAAAGRVTVRVRSWFLDSQPINFNQLEQFA